MGQGDVRRWFARPALAAAPAPSMGRPGGGDCPRPPPGPTSESGCYTTNEMQHIGRSSAMVWQGQEGSGDHVPIAVRRAVRRRDGDTCQLGYAGCTGQYQELDHIDGIAARGVLRTSALTVDELQCVCRSCHKVKTQWQAKVGRGLGTPEPVRSNTIGRVPLPDGFRYAPPARIDRGWSMLTSVATQHMTAQGATPSPHPHPPR